MGQTSSCQEVGEDTFWRTSGGTPVSFLKGLGAHMLEEVHSRVIAGTCFYPTSGSQFTAVNT